MRFCLTVDTKNKFKKALREGAIDPIKLSGMSSVERNKFLSGFVGKENSTGVNSLFESKLLLKNQKAGYISWAKKVMGIRPEVRRDLISKIERMDRVLDPKEGEQFLQDLANTKLGVNVTETEAKKISEMSKVVSDLRSKTDTNKSDVPLGRAKLDLIDYVNKLGGKKADLATNIAGLPRTIMSSFDLSAPLNQGWGMLSRKRFYTSLGTMLKSAASEGAYRDLQAEIITHPKYDLAKKSGLRLTELGNRLELREEQFMSSLADKVPVLSGSQRAYTAFLNKLRMDSFSDLVKKAEVAGEDVGMGSKSAEDLAKVVNNFTGGARVGKVEGAVPLLNATFFSPRKIKSTIEIMNPINYVSPKISKTARNEATRNLIGSVALSAGVIALYGLLTGRKQETDPTSTDFGKIKSGDTRLDTSGGNATYLNLLSRLVTGKIKGQSGISRKLGTGYGETSGADLVAQFLRYKLSPNASLLIDAVTGANAIGEKKTILQSVIDRFKPMFANSVVELLKSDTSGKFGFALGGLFGAGLNTYKPTSADWSISEGKELLQFKEKVGEDKFKQANETFNKSYDEWFKKVQNNQTYKSLSDEEKQKAITKKKNELKSEIFKQYQFKYKQEKSKDIPSSKDLESSAKPPNKLAEAIQGLRASKQVPGASAWFWEKKKMLSPKPDEESTPVIPEAEASKPIIKAPQKAKPTETTYGRNPSTKKVKADPVVHAAIADASKKYGIPAEILYDIGFSESSLNPNPPKNPKSSAGGLFQFTNGTWETVKNYARMKGSTLKLPSIDKNDPRSSAMAAAYLIKNGQLGRWDASKWNWGEYWSDDELEEMGFYKQTKR